MPFQRPPEDAVKGPLIRPAPAAILFMIVGPHSGFSLSEILAMKSAEAIANGQLYWGYGGTLCSPLVVQRFARDSMAKFAAAPIAVFAATRVAYHPKSLGSIRQYSEDGKKYSALPPGVTMIGCSVAITCTDLCAVEGRLDVNRYRVAGGSRDGTALGEFIRYRINKACAWHGGPDAAGAKARVVDVVATARLVPPYCVYLRE